MEEGIPKFRLRILGPNGSDALVAALDDDLGNLQKEAEDLKTAGALRNFQRNWQTLANLRLISAEFDGVGRTAAQGSQAVSLVLLPGRATRKTA